MREEIVQKGQWIGLVAETFFALTGTQKERKIAVCPTTHLQDDVCVTALLVRIGLLREDQFLPFALILPGSPQNRCGFVVCQDACRFLNQLPAPIMMEKMQGR